jgi:O-antigen/teichoic acid export membrane protein
MSIITFVKRSQSLALLSLVEYGTPFFRMMALSRLLPLRELGFTSALTATNASFFLLTDFGTHRFVLSVPREDYEEALASTHALTFLRGILVGVLGIALAPLIAATFSLTEDWESFALVASVFFIGSFEHLGPRVDERNYRYGVQLRVSLIANGLGLGALLISLALTRSHEAIIASLFAQAIGQVAASQFLAGTPYRMNFRSRYFRQAVRFGYPLMINGLGLAVSSQGDRFLVGSLLGLPALALYSVATLVTLVPMNMVFRFVGTFMLAALYNVANRTDESYAARVRLSARLVPIAGAVYALGIVTLLNIVMPLVFGSQFTLSVTSVALLGLVAFFRMARQDPFTSMLLHEGRTRRLAITNLASSSALLFEVVLIKAFGTFEAVIAGRLLGEMTALALVIYMTRVAFRPALRDFLLAVSVCATVVMMVVGLAHVTPVGRQLAPSIAALAACVAILAGWTSKYIPPLLRAARFSQQEPLTTAEKILDTAPER